MVLNEETVEMINYAKDIEIEYNIKLILLAFFISLSLFLLWYRKRLGKEDRLKELGYYFITAFSIITISIIPMYVFLLLRSVAIEIVLKYIIIFYGVLVSMTILYSLWWLAQLMLSKWFGVRFKGQKKSLRDESSYRRVG